MKLKKISIENFRGYKSRVTVTFEDLKLISESNFEFWTEIKLNSYDEV